MSFFALRRVRQRVADAVAGFAAPGKIAVAARAAAVASGPVVTEPEAGAPAPKKAKAKPELRP